MKKIATITLLKKYQNEIFAKINPPKFDTFTNAGIKCTHQKVQYGEILNNDEIRVEFKLKLSQNRYKPHFWIWNKTADKNAITEFTKAYNWDKTSF